MINQKKVLSWLKNYWHQWEKWHLLILGVGLGSLTLFLLFQGLKIDLPTQVPLSEAKETVSSYQIGKSITVKVLSGNYWGSGILMDREKSVYRVITNAHVLNPQATHYQIQTPDGKFHQAVRRSSESSFQGNDLALLEFVSSETEYAIAKLGNAPRPGDKVLGTGFPFMTSQNGGVVFKTGVVWQMLDKPIEGGYQLGYTNDIEKGMSGGPLINEEGEVVAINGMHAYPLWGNPYVYEDGTVPESSLLEQMSDYSWGIPIERFQKIYSRK